MPKIIAFSGIDGSGKSTQCELLCESLRREGKRIQCIHMLTPAVTVGSKAETFTVVRHLRDLRKLPDHGISRYVRLACGLVYYFCSAWLTYVTHVLKYRDKILVYDRYYLDQLVIFAANFTKVPQWVMHLHKLFPPATIHLVVLVSPQVSYARKQEHALETIEKYYTLFSYFIKHSQRKAVDGTQDKNIIKEVIRKKIAEIGV